MTQWQSLNKGLLFFLLGSILIYLYGLLFWRMALPATAPTKMSLEHMDTSGEPKRILVTGAAGFIGFHLSRILQQGKNDLVIAVDNFNDYYDVRLKMDRAFELHKLGIQVYHDDVCNTAFLEEMFVKHNFTHVAHLAAQAGVRYSLENPMAYIRANVECQIALMDVITKYPHTKLVYASSSSVYGKKSAIPFTLSARTDQPGNMYAATKKTDEILAYYYCQEYGLSTVGLRFFTVYGPWGRPDMAVFKFAQSILDDEPVPMFDTIGLLPLSRDFTYVDDVVAGIQAALDYRPAVCGERFNLGFGKPVSVPGLVDILQEELNIKATVKKLPMPPTEILQTFADITTSTQLLGFKPLTDLKTGCHNFVNWYREYRKQRVREEATDAASQAEEWFLKVIEDKIQRGAKYEDEATERHNEFMSHRLEHERHKYDSWAASSGIDLPEIHKDSFDFFSGVDSDGGDILHAPALKNNIKGLEEKCREIEQCVAFNSNGLLKSSIRPASEWQQAFRGDGQGLYVAHVDMCKADLHTCDRYADCLSQDFSSYTCTCKDGFSGSGQYCLPKYDHLTPRELQVEYLAEYHNLVNITEMKTGKSMVFFQGKDSPGGDYMVIDMNNKERSEAQLICQQDPICIGVTTTGMMKRRIISPDDWPTWTTNTEHGIYVYDINYCLVSNDPCPDHSSCQWVAPAEYKCQCEPGYNMHNHECIQQPPARPEQQPIINSNNIEQPQQLQHKDNKKDAHQSDNNKNDIVVPVVVAADAKVFKGELT